MAGRAGSRKRKLINVNWGGAGGGRCRSRRMTTKRSVMVVKLVVAKEDNSVMDNDVIVTS